MAQGSQATPIQDNWKVTVFDCSKNCTMCLFSCCVPCGIACMQCYEFRTLLPANNDSTLACLIAACCGFIGAAWNRTKLREVMKIEGNFLMDLVCYCCCPYCSATQEWREVMMRVHKKDDFNIFNIPQQNTASPTKS